MLTIRLIKIGKRNNSNFRVVLIDKTAAPKSGKFLEILGNYNPHSKEINLEGERIKYWISKGAQVSETVHNLLVRKGVIEDAKIKKNIKEKKKKTDSESESESEEKKEEIKGETEEKVEERVEKETEEDKKPEKPVEQKKEEKQNDVKEE